MEWLRRHIDRYQAELAIIDPTARFVQVRDIKDYAEITRRSEPLIQVAHDTGCHIAMTHHARKGEAAGLDAVLGSIQLAGMVDTIVLLNRHRDDRRTLQTYQRTGTDIPESALMLDKSTGLLSLAGSIEAMVMTDRMAVVRDFVAAHASCDEPTILSGVGGDKASTGKALRALHAEGRLCRTGDGRKGDPYLYVVPTPKRDQGESGST
jgi:hypothetical protein